MKPTRRSIFVVVVAAALLVTFVTLLFYPAPVQSPEPEPEPKPVPATSAPTTKLCTPLSPTAHINPERAVVGETVAFHLRFDQGSGPVTVTVGHQVVSRTTVLENPVVGGEVFTFTAKYAADYWFDLTVENGCDEPRKYLFFIQVFPQPTPSPVTSPFKCDANFTQCLLGAGFTTINSDCPQGYQGFQALYPSQNFLPTYGWGEKVSEIRLDNGIVYSPIITTSIEGKTLVFMKREIPGYSGKAGFFVEPGTIVIFVSYELEYQPFNINRLDIFKVSATHTKESGASFVPAIEHWPAEK